MGSENLVQSSLEKFFTKYPQFQEENAYAVAVSGGPDSLALAHSLFHSVALENKELHVLTVDHGLRETAKLEAEKVSDWVRDQKTSTIYHAILLWEGVKPESALMEEARAARYDLMAQYCLKHNISSIFVAHHQDDQAETFLIRLAKGSGLDGLAGIGEVQNYNKNLKILRPLLDVSKQDLLDCCTNSDLEFSLDPSNENTNYLRPRLRKSMGVLEKEGLSVKRLTTLTRRLRRARQALEEISNKSYEACLKEKTEHRIILDVQKLRIETEEIAFRVFQKAVKEMSGVAGYGVRMDRLENLFQSLWYNVDGFKPRTLGGFIFLLKDKTTALHIEVEHIKKG